jgi:hypothetical protein
MKGETAMRPNLIHPENQRSARGARIAWALVLLAPLVAGGAAYGQAGERGRAIPPTQLLVEWDAPERSDPLMTGTWRLLEGTFPPLPGRPIQFETFWRTNAGLDVAAHSELDRRSGRGSGLLEDASMLGRRWVIVQPAGRFVLEAGLFGRGVRDGRGGRGGRPAGRIRFEGDIGFARGLERIIGRPVGGEALVHLALLDVDLDFVRRLDPTGRRPPTINEILRAKALGITPDDIVGPPPRRAEPPRELPLSADDIIKLRRAGVPPEFLAALAQLGYVISTDDILKMFRSGVNAEFLDALAGFFHPFKADDIIDLRRSWTSPDLLRAAAALNPNFAADDVEDLRRAGVPPEYLLALAECGPAYEADDIIDLRRAGVPAEYLAAVSRIGYPFSASEIKDLWRAGVSVDYLAGLARAGRAYPADEIIRMRRAGVPPDYVGWRQ